MILATIRVSGVQTLTHDYPSIPAGLVGGEVAFAFEDPLWDTLTKTAVFRGCVTRDVLMTGDTVRIPAETVDQRGPRLMVGVYGTDAGNNVVIPTLWCSLGTIRDAADPSGDPGTDPELPIWAQLQERVEDLEENGGGGGTGEDGEDGGYYTPAVTQPAEDTIQFDWTPSKSDMPAVDPVQVTMPHSGGNVAQTEPAEDDIPKVFITGVKPTTKDDVLAEMEYVSKTDKFHAYLTIKCQGTSSMSYPKKNFTVKLYSDEARETKLKKDFKDWNHPGNKFVLKANYIDHSHARNIVSARLWGEVVASRPDYDSLPVEMRNAPNNGAVDGFPVKIYYNGTYEGIYTWNIGKDDWMWGMDEDNANHVLLCAELNVATANPCNFNALWGGTDGTHWSVEVGTNSTALKTSLNNLIQFVMDNDGDDFRNGIGAYLDVQSAIDYYIFQYEICGLDGLAKNMLLATYDGTKWICGAYDLDSTYGLWWNGSKFVSAEYACPEDYQANASLLWERIEANYVEELKARQAELRKTVLSYSNMVTHFERFMDVIGLDLYAEDLTIYTGIPSGSTNNIKQIRNYIRDRQAYVDAEFAAMSGDQPDIPEQPDNPEPSEIPCTGIALDKMNLTFDSVGTQTITATVTPSDTTDTMAWVSSAPAVASITVEGNVCTVQSVENGDAVITVSCGEHSASCAVSVSGIAAPEPVYSLTVPHSMTAGSTYDTGYVALNEDKDITAVISIDAPTINNDRLFSLASEFFVRKHGYTGGRMSIVFWGSENEVSSAPVFADNSKTKIILTHKNGSGSCKAKILNNGAVYSADITAKNTFTENITVKLGPAITGTVSDFKIYDYVWDADEIDTYLDIKPCSGISLDKTELTFNGMGTQTLAATVTPDGCTDRLTWESDNISVAIVNDGVVTASGNGSATITAKCGAQSAKCVVSVSGINIIQLRPDTELPSGYTEAVIDGTQSISIPGYASSWPSTYGSTAFEYILVGGSVSDVIGPSGFAKEADKNVNQSANKGTHPMFAYVYYNSKTYLSVSLSAAEVGTTVDSVTAWLKSNNLVFYYKE